MVVFISINLVNKKIQGCWIMLEIEYNHKNRPYFCLGVSGVIKVLQNLVLKWNGLGIDYNSFNNKATLIGHKLIFFEINNTQIGIAGYPHWQKIWTGNKAIFFKLCFLTKP